MDKSLLISLYLLHPSLTEFDQALISKTGLKIFNIKDEFDFDAKLYIRESQSSIPDWVSLLSEGFDGVPAIENVYNGAVIICKVENRFFAFTFGNGRYLLEPLYKEHRFGLKVAMTLFAESGLRGAVTKRKVSDVLLSTNTQSSREVSLNDLRVTENLDRIMGLVGKPTDSALADRVEGKDSLSLKTKIDFHKIKGNLKALLDRYNGDIPDHFKKYSIKEQQIYDTEIIKRLDEDLCSAMNDQDKRESIFFVPPGVIEYDQVDTFCFTKDYPPKKGEAQDLGGFLDEADFDAICNAEKWSPEKVKEAHIGYKNSDENIIRWKWSLYQCLEYDTKDNDKTCIFSEGNWYCINKEDIDKYESLFQQYLDKMDVLPDAKSNEGEDSYNSRTAKDKKMLLLHKKLILPPGATSKIEFCDLLSPDGEIVHIKKGNGSSNLSHLFDQGSVSAELFLGNVRVRTDIQESVILAILENYATKDKMKDIKDNKRNILQLLLPIFRFQTDNEPQTETIKNELMKYVQENEINQIIELVKEYGRLIPMEGIIPSDYTIIYGIISKSKKSGEKSIPFFSKVNFAQHVSILETMGFKPKIAMIP